MKLRIPVLVTGISLVLGLSSWLFLYPALTPDLPRGRIVGSITVRTDTGNTLWVLAEQSRDAREMVNGTSRHVRNNPETTVYVRDPATGAALVSHKTRELSYRQAVLLQAGDKVWEFSNGEWADQPAMIRAFDAASGKLLLGAAEFQERFPLLKAGIKSCSQDDDGMMILDTMDGLEDLVFDVATEKVYKSREAWQVVEGRKNALTAVMIGELAKDQDARAIWLVTGDPAKMDGRIDRISDELYDPGWVSRNLGGTAVFVADLDLTRPAVLHRGSDGILIWGVSPKPRGIVVSAWGATDGRALWSRRLMELPEYPDVEVVWTQDRIWTLVSSLGGRTHLEIRDAASLKKTGDEKSLEKQFNELSGGIRDISPPRADEPGTVKISASDGREWFYDLESGSLSASIEALRLKSLQAISTEHVQLFLGKDGDNDARQVLYEIRGKSPAALQKALKRVDPEELDQDDQTALGCRISRMDSPEVFLQGITAWQDEVSLLVIHQTTVERGAPVSFTLVDARSGKILWTRPQSEIFGAGYIPFARSHRAGKIVVIQGNENQLIGLDLTSGTLVWKLNT